MIFKGLVLVARCCLSSAAADVLASVLSRVRWLPQVGSDSSNGTDRLDAATRIVCWRESDGRGPTPSELVSRTRHPTFRGAVVTPSMPLDGWAWLLAQEDGPKHPACMVVLWPFRWARRAQQPAYDLCAVNTKLIEVEAINGSR